MGACVSSSNNEEGEQKKRSQMIDRSLEEDSKRLKRECKILLLGMSFHHPIARAVACYSLSSDSAGCGISTSSEFAG